MALLCGKEEGRVQVPGGPLKDWAAGPTGRRRLRTPEMRVQVPRGPLAWAHGPRGRHQFGRLEIRVQLPVGPLRKVAGYGWPGRSAKAVLPTEMRVRLPCLPLDAPMVKWTIIPRFERGVPGSNPGRGAYAVPSFSGQDIPVTWERSQVRILPGLV